MKRILVCGLVSALVATGVVLGAAAGGLWATERGLVRSSLANNTIQLLVLEHLQSNDLEEAIRMLDWEVDARAVFLDGMLAEGGMSAELESLTSCHLQKIRSYRTEHTLTYEDREYGELVAQALAGPADCLEHEDKVAARATRPV